MKGTTGTIGNRSEGLQVVIACLFGLLLSSSARGASFEIIAAGEATDTSASGDVVVGLTPESNGIWRWTSHAGYEILDDAGDLYAISRLNSPDVSDDGRVISGAMILADDQDLLPAVWTAESGWHTAESLRYDGSGPTMTGGIARGLSGNGRVIVGTISETGVGSGGLAMATWGRGTIYSGAAGRLPQSRANDANFDGSLVVGWRGGSAAETHQPTVWDRYGATPLAPGGVWGDAVATSPDGHIVVGHAYDKKTHQVAAALWLRSDYGWVQEFLGTLPGTVEGMGEATALDLSSDGTVIVGRNRFDGHRAAGFVWMPGLGLMNVHDYLEQLGIELPRDFTIDTVTGVSHDGTVLVGVGKDERDWPSQTLSFMVRGAQIASNEQPRREPARAGLGATNPFEQKQLEATR